MKNIIELLILKKKTISTMESCTGGAIANFLTNIPDASQVFSFSAVTYSNEYKIKMGVSPDIINKYSVYSLEVAKDMAKKIASYTNSSFGVGITGKLKKSDPNNPYGSDDQVFLSIYDQEHDKYYNEIIKLNYNSRKENKEQIINIFVDKMQNILNN